MKRKSTPAPNVPPHSGVAQLLKEIRALRSRSLQSQKQSLEHWKPHLHLKGFQPSAANLAAYIGLRRHDVRHLQCQLADLGLSSLGRCEAHVLPSLDAVIRMLKIIHGEGFDAEELSHTRAAMDNAGKLLRKHTDRLLGPPPSHRWARIMVTLPSEAAKDYVFVRELVLRGMDCARINCAHDDPSAWQRMVQFVRQAEQETGRSCKILMDIAGPKLRTGPVLPGDAIVHLKPKRDQKGHLAQAASVILDGSGNPGCQAERDSLGRRTPARLAVNAEWQAQLDSGDSIRFSDMRDKQRELVVLKRISNNEVLASCDDGAILTPGIKLRHQPQGKRKPGAATVVGPVQAPPLTITLNEGDPLLLTREEIPGVPAVHDEDGNTIHAAHISCTMPAVFSFLKFGQRVWIDDGRIGARVESVNDSGALLRITQARPEGEKLRSDKGLNFPDSELSLPVLTDKDYADLDFAAAHADMIGYSFVQSGEDMDSLMTALAERKSSQIGIVAKIETRRALQNLPEIIIRGAGRHPFGVMIARGDLAVEIGYERLAEIQEEILWLCEAAHVPVIWATQVLEGMVKQHAPSRAEMTDAAMGERAECIMLNKGPFVLDAIAVLDNVVARMQAHHQKKTAQLRALHW